MFNWDRNCDWVLHRFLHDLTHVTIRFRNGKPSLNELAAVRRCLPKYRNTAPAAVQKAFGHAGELLLGAMPTPEARKIIEVARNEGLEVVAEDASFVSYLPFNRTSGCALLIDDNLESQAVAQSMLAAGIPVQVAEA